MNEGKDGKGGRMLLVIRPEQMRIMAANAMRSMLTEHAISAHDAAAMDPAALEERVSAVVRLCDEYGVERTADQLKIMDLSLVFGADWRSPDCQWLAEGMRDPSVRDPSVRVGRLWRRALRRLSREASCPSP